MDPRFRLDVDLLDAKFQSCAILDTLVPARKDKWRAMLDRPWNDRDDVVDLVNFSFLDDPASALDGFKKIAAVEGSSRSARLNFKDTHCEDAG